MEALSNQANATELMKCVICEELAVRDALKLHIAEKHFDYYPNKCQVCGHGASDPEVMFHHAEETGHRVVLNGLAKNPRVYELLEKAFTDSIKEHEAEKAVSGGESVQVEPSVVGSNYRRVQSANTQAAVREPSSARGEGASDFVTSTGGMPLPLVTTTQRAQAFSEIPSAGSTLPLPVTTEQRAKISVKIPRRHVPAVGEVFGRRSGPDSTQTSRRMERRRDERYLPRKTAPASPLRAPSVRPQDISPLRAPSVRPQDISPLCAPSVRPQNNIQSGRRDSTRRSIMEERAPAGVICQLCNEVVEEGSRRDHVAKKHAGFSFLCPVGWCKSDGVAFSGEGQTALNNLYGHLNDEHGGRGRLSRRENDEVSRQVDDERNQRHRLYDRCFPRRRDEKRDAEKRTRTGGATPARSHLSEKRTKRG